MTDDAKSELQDLLNQQGSNPMQHTKDEPEHYKQIQTEAELTFVKKCCKSKYTKACLELMKDGQVPFRLVDTILKNSNSLWNKCLSFFKSDISLESLIGKYNIAILQQGDRCVALDPNDEQKVNDKKIANFVGNTTDVEDLVICSHGTCAYSYRIPQNNRDTLLYLSNIPSGFIAINSGIKERHDKYKQIILSLAENFNQKKNNNSNIIIETESYSNLLGAMIAKTLAEEKYEISELNLMNVANGYYFFQNTDDIADTILSIKPGLINKIKKINTSSSGKTFHPVENGKYLADKLQNKLSANNHTAIDVNNTLAYHYPHGEYIKYTGNLINGKFNGQGELISYNKDKQLEFFYEGKFKDGNMNGKGKIKLYNKDGNLDRCYEGDFKDDKYNGKGELIFYNKDGESKNYSYEGDFKDDKCHGKGKLTFYNKNGESFCSYEGDFKDDKYNGKEKFYGSDNYTSQLLQNKDIDNSQIQEYNTRSQHKNNQNNSPTNNY